LPDSSILFDEQRECHAHRILDQRISKKINGLSIAEGVSRGSVFNFSERIQFSGTRISGGIRAFR